MKHIAHTTPRVGILAPISHNIPPNGYGSWELVVYNLVEGLVGLGVDVTLYATEAARVSSVVHASFSQPFSSAEDEQTRRTRELIHIVQGLKDLQSCDIIHNHLNIHPVLFAELIDTPVVTTLHGAACETHNHPYYEQVKDRPFISLSQAERAFFPGLNYVDTVPNGVDFSAYTPRTEVGSYLVFSGRVIEEKGVLSAIELAEKTNVPLRIAGPITDQTFFDAQVRPHIDNRHIHYEGELDHMQLNTLLRGALAVVFMPEWNEPFGLSAVDAFATGVPVIGNYDGAVPELVFHKDLGILAHTVKEAADRIDEIRKLDPSACRERARTKFSREAMAQRYLENYCKILS